MCEQDDACNCSDCDAAASIAAAGGCFAGAFAGKRQSAEYADGDSACDGFGEEELRADAVGSAERLTVGIILPRVIGGD